MAWRERRRSIRLVVTSAAIITALLLPPASASLAKQATPQSSPIAESSGDELPPAWLEFGPGGQLLARVIVASDCPEILLDGRAVAMLPRSSPSADFPVIACEAAVPFGVRNAAIHDQSLPIPQGPFERIAVIGDTGCRLNDWEKEYQSCNDPQAWPFAQVAASVAAWQPDLIVHVGDYLYRESPCPPSGFDCSGSPHGDNWPTWNADFFTPVSSLLGAAPWVFMRGNHETCDRNAGGWFAYLDTRAFQTTCQTFTEPYVAPLNGLTLAVIDSAEASDETVKPGEEDEYKREFTHLAQISPLGSWLVTHRPVWAIFDASHGETEATEDSYEAAIGDDSLHGHYGLILSGHVHLAEALAFDESSGRPPQIVSGNSGTALDNIPTASPNRWRAQRSASRRSRNPLLLRLPHARTGWLGLARRPAQRRGRPPPPMPPRPTRNVLRVSRIAGKPRTQRPYCVPSGNTLRRQHCPPPARRLIS